MIPARQRPSSCHHQPISGNLPYVISRPILEPPSGGPVAASQKSKYLSSGLRPIHVAELVPLLKSAKGEVPSVAGFAMDLVGWKGPAFEFKASYSSSDEEQSTDHTATLSWDSTTDQVRLIGDKVDGVRKITPEP